MQANQHLQPTAASVPLAVPSSLRSSAAAEVRRSAHTRASRMEGAIVVVLVEPNRTKV
jgi:hypothetical protein